MREVFPGARPPLDYTVVSMVSACALQREVTIVEFGGRSLIEPGQRVHLPNIMPGRPIAPEPLVINRPLPGRRRQR